MRKFLYYIFLILLILFILLIYSRFIGTTGLKTNEIVIHNKNISDSYDSLKIIQFSDLHYKKIINKKRVSELVDEINKLKPDLVLFNGDLFDKDSKINNNDINFIIKQLSKITASYGKYSVMGDNDYKYKEDIKNIYIQSEFTLLENSSDIIYNNNNDKIIISGLESGIKNKIDIEKSLNSIDKDMEYQYSIVMIHEGDYVNKIINKYDNVDLILAGHSLNGSINIPIIKKLFLPNGSKTYYSDHYVKDNTNIYVSNGIGVDKINFRFFNEPSINLFKLKRTS